MVLPRWFWTGITGGFAGMAIWVSIGYFAQAEIGFIAWGVGFLVGASVRYGVLRDDDADVSLVQGVFASLTALASIIAAKYLLLSVVLMSYEPPEMMAVLETITTEQAMIVPIADTVVSELTAAGKKLKWPRGQSLETAEKEADYPAGVWKEAKKRWDNLDESQREALKEERRQAHRQLMNSLRPSFSQVLRTVPLFSPYDLLWLGLAAISAFKTGLGIQRTDD